MDIFLENIIVGKADTTANWTSDATVYSLGFMMISSDATYSGTNVKKWKIANGVDAWADIDFVRVAETLAQILANGNKTNELKFESNNGYATAEIVNSQVYLRWFNANYNNQLGLTDGATYLSYYNITTNKLGLLSFNDANALLQHTTLIDLNAPSVKKNGFEIATINDILLKVLTGLNVTGSSISATDTILQAFGKLQNQINGVLGGAIYQGIWNATTNTPSLSSGVGTKGHYYVVSVAGSTNIDGTTDWKIGDWIIFNGTNWDKVDNTDAVSSVNGFIGAVNLTTANVSEVTNLYFTQARVLATLLTGYVSGSGTITASDTILQAIQKLNGNVALKEDASNKTDTVAGNTTSSTKYLSVKGFYDYVIADTRIVKSSFDVSFDGQGGVITVNANAIKRAVANGGTVTGFSLKGDVSGSIEIDMKKNGVSMVGAGNKIDLVTQSSDTGSPTSWTSTTFVADDEIEFVVSSATTITKLWLTIKYDKTT